MDGREESLRAVDLLDRPNTSSEGTGFRYRGVYSEIINPANSKTYEVRICGSFSNGWMPGFHRRRACKDRIRRTSTRLSRSKEFQGRLTWVVAAVVVREIYLIRISLQDRSHHRMWRRRNREFWEHLLLRSHPSCSLHCLWKSWTWCNERIDRLLDKELEKSWDHHRRRW